MDNENIKKSNKIIYKKNKHLSDEIANVKNVEGMYSLLSKKIPNPDEILKKTGQGIEVLKKLANDGQVATCITSRSSGVTSLEYQLKYSDSTQKYKDFYDKLLKVIDIDNFIKDVLKAPAYGFQPIEITWSVNNEGYIIPKKIQAKPQEWFYFNTDNELCFKQKGMPDGLIITEDMKKFLCPSIDADYLNPYGHGYLSRCFWDVAFKRGSLEFWIKFAEKFGMPHVIAKYEEGTSDDEIDELLDAADAMVQDAVAAIPNNASIELKEASGKTASAEIYKGLIDVCDASIAKNIIGQTLTTESGDTGSYALGKVHFQVRQDIINSDKQLVEKEFNKLLKWVHEINFGDNDAPSLELYAEEDVDKALAERDSILNSTGVKFTKQYYMKAYGFSEEDIIVDNQQDNDIKDFAENNKKGKNFTKQSLKNPQSNIDDFIDSFSDAELEGMISEKIMPIIKDFAQVQDPEKALENLAVIYPEKDSKSLEETLTKSIFLANLWGQVNAENK